MPFKKVKIIQDWLLGVQPHCLYSKYQNASVLREEGTTQSNEVLSGVLPKQETLTDTKVNNNIQHDQSMHDFKIDENNRQSGSTNYISESYHSEMENEDNDDSIADSDYKPHSPKHPFGNLNVSQIFKNFKNNN